MSTERDRRSGNGTYDTGSSHTTPPPGRSTLTSKIQRRAVADVTAPVSAPVVSPAPAAPAPTPSEPFIDPYAVHLLDRTGAVQRTAAPNSASTSTVASRSSEFAALADAVGEGPATADASTVVSRSTEFAGLADAAGEGPASVGASTVASRGTEFAALADDAGEGPSSAGGSTEASRGTELAALADAAGEGPSSAGASTGAAPSAARLSAPQLATARRRNMRHHQRLRFDVGAFGGGSPDSNEFALAVAEYQTSTGGALGVDGIAGPQTCKHKGCLPGGHAATHEAAHEDDESAGEGADAPEFTRGRRDAVGAAERAQPSAIDQPKEESLGNHRDTLPIQARADGPLALDSERVHAHAAAGVQGAGGPMPHAAQIKASFGAHAPVVDGIQAYVGGAAADASKAIGAEAYATGNAVAFKSAPDVFTAAHEAAHVVQQQAGVQLLGGVGEVGDAYERNADEVAAAVVRGDGAEQLLENATRGGRSAAHARSRERTEPVQLRAAGPQVPPAGAATQPKSGAYHPTTVAVPIVKPQLKLFSTYTQTFRVTNTAQAPAGTTFEWDGGSDLETINITETDDGAAVSLEVRANRPGVGTVSGRPVFTVPGQSEMGGLATDISVFIPAPTAATQHVTRMDAAGTVLQGPPGRAAVNDLLRYRLKLSNLDAKGLEKAAPMALLGGAGATIVTLAGVTLVESVPDGLVFDVELKPFTVGYASGTIQLAIGALSPGAASPVPFEIHVEMDRGRFLQLCSASNTLLDLADRKATAYLASLANAYARAWRSHTSVLKAQSISDAIPGDLVLGAAMAFVPGGLGGLVGGVMKKAEHGDFIVDGIKDLTKWGGRRGGAEVKFGSSAGFAAFPTDPLEWQNLQTTRIKSEIAIATQILLGWQTKVIGNDPDFFADFDPFVAMGECLTVLGERADLLTPVDDGMADTFEKGFWKMWLEKYAYTISTGYRKPGIPYANVREQNGSEIKRRCDEIGLDWIPYAAVSENVNEVEADRRNAENS